MTKKLDGGEVVQNVLENVSVTTDIAMRITQSDLVDMIMVEYEDKLEAAVETAKEACELAEKEVNREVLSVVAKEIVEENFSDLLAALKIINKTLTFSMSSSSSCDDEDDTKTSYSISIEGKSSTDRWKKNVSVELENVKTSYFKNNKKYASYLQAKKNLNQAREAWSDARNEFSKVSKMGKRMKASLVRELMKSNDAGKKLLSEVNKVSAGLKLLK